MGMYTNTYDNTSLKQDRKEYKKGLWGQGFLGVANAIGLGSLTQMVPESQAFKKKRKIVAEQESDNAFLLGKTAGEGAKLIATAAINPDQLLKESINAGMGIGYQAANSRTRNNPYGSGVAGTPVTIDKLGGDVSKMVNSFGEKQGNISSNAVSAVKAAAAEDVGANIGNAGADAVTQNADLSIGQTGIGNIVPDIDLNGIAGSFNYGGSVGKIKLKSPATDSSGIIQGDKNAGVDSNLQITNEGTFIIPKEQREAFLNVVSSVAPQYLEMLTKPNTPVEKDGVPIRTEPGEIQISPELKQSLEKVIDLQKFAPFAKEQSAKGIPGYFGGTVRKVGTFKSEGDDLNSGSGLDSMFNDAYFNPMTITNFALAGHQINEAKKMRAPRIPIQQVVPPRLLQKINPGIYSRTIEEANYAANQQMQNLGRGEEGTIATHANKLDALGKLNENIMSANLNIDNQNTQTINEYQEKLGSAMTNQEMAQIEANMRVKQMADQATSSGMSNISNTMAAAFNADRTSKNIDKGSWYNMTPYLFDEWLKKENENPAYKGKTTQEMYQIFLQLYGKDKLGLYSKTS